MIRPLSPPRVPSDVYHGHMGRCADGADATATRPGCGGPCAARPALSATSAGEFQACFTAGEATPCPERRQGTVRRGQRPTFFSRLHRHRPSTHDDQQGQRPHHEREMPSPRPSSAALPTDPGPLLPWPPHRHSPPSSGGPPRAPPPPTWFPGGQRPQRRSTPWGRRDSAGPATSGTSQAPADRPGAASTSHPSEGLSRRHPRSAGSSPRRAGWPRAFSRGAAASPAPQIPCPTLPVRKPAAGSPTTAAAAGQRPTRGRR